ncbi:hypothetical protein ACWDHH_06945 [Janibacter hoylei]|uniref:hypothetical protein n=1 Tax=Janibacter hoylei TaxID=364298 RepID=UPI00223867E9|nr:hypothetical protein [Janibacter hoylei]MCW4601895.1 hypothetical protein [Janibacter hoylei]
MLVAFAVFLPVRFGWLPRSGALDLVVDVVGIIGAGIVIGLMAFGFFGARVGIALGAVFAVGVAPFAIGVISQYPALSGSLAAYAISTIVCVVMSFASRQRPFDFALIARRTGDFTDDESLTGDDDLDLEPARS